MALTSTLSPSRVAKHLRWGCADLKRHIALHHERAMILTPPGFVEVPPPPAQLQILGRLEVEIHRPDGARLSLHSADASLTLATLVHSCLEARSCFNSPRKAVSFWPLNRSIVAQASMASVPCADSASVTTPSRAPSTSSETAPAPPSHSYSTTGRATGSV